MILVDILLLPLRAVRGTATDMYEILKTWKRYALEYEANYRRQQVCTLRWPSSMTPFLQPCSHADYSCSLCRALQWTQLLASRDNNVLCAVLVRLKTLGGLTALPGRLKRQRW